MQDVVKTKNYVTNLKRGNLKFTYHKSKWLQLSMGSALEYAKLSENICLVGGVKGTSTGTYFKEKVKLELSLTMWRVHQLLSTWVPWPQPNSVTSTLGLLCEWHKPNSGIPWNILFKYFTCIVGSCVFIIIETHFVSFKIEFPNTPSSVSSEANYSMIVNE